MTTRMKNVAIDILEYEERKKDNKEWFSEDVDSCWSTTVGHTKAYVARPGRAKEWNMGIKRRGWMCTVCRKKKQHIMHQQLIAIEEEFKERNPRQAYRMVENV